MRKEERVGGKEQLYHKFSHTQKFQAIVVSLVNMFFKYLKNRLVKL